ncbi:MAG: hypothetical protein AAGI23_20280 [Bacteroidota bacterium]
MDKEKISLPPKEEVTGFQVPEGYFEQLEQDVWTRIEATSKPRVLWQSWAVAATVALLLGIGSYFFFTSASPSDAVLSQQDALEYIEDNLEEFEEELLISNWDETDANHLEPTES